MILGCGVDCGGLLGKEDHANEKNQRPSELNGNRNTVAAAIISVVGGIVDDTGEEKTDSNAELVGTDDCTTDPLRSRLGLIERN